MIRGREAVGLGLCIAGAAVSGVALVMRWLGWLGPESTVGLLFVFFMVACGVAGRFMWKDIAAEQAWDGLRRQAEQARLEERRAPPAAAPAAPAPPPVVVIRKLPIKDKDGIAEVEMVERRPARWVAWQTLALAYLDWVRIRGGATSGLLVGPSAMFAERGQWVDATNGLRDGGMLKKTNGRTTEIESVDSILSIVQEGKFTWPVDRDPPAYRPAPVEIRAVVSEIA